MKRFVHPCRCCVPTGSDEHHDFYYCTLGTLVARFGNEPWAVHVGRDVAEAMVAAGDSTHPLAASLRHARRLGFMR